MVIQGNSVTVYFDDFLYFETTHSRKITEIDLLANIGIYIFFLVMLKGRPNRPGPASADLGLSGRTSVRLGLYRNCPKLGLK
jgi:hypothetical protein